MPESWDYQKAGLNLETYAETMAGIQPLLARTWDAARVVPPPFPPRKGGKGSGGFASLFDFQAVSGHMQRYTHPLLVTCTDGVGSKLKVAHLMKKYDTVGIDLVAMSVNDLICTGGEPLVFLDYIAMPADDKDLTLQLVTGISEGCVRAGVSLVGGETAILPDFYAPGDFDTAGFCAGLAEKAAVIDGRAIRDGDVLIGLASSGPHANGYSLIRKVIFEAANLSVTDAGPRPGVSVGDELLAPTRIYVKPIRAMLAAVQTPEFAVSGLANITGGGIPDNLGRILPPGVRATVRRGSWPVPDVFKWIQRLGNVAQLEMEKVFNTGVGFVVVCRLAAAEAVLRELTAAGETAWVIGEVAAGETGVEVV
jgi:phosphoribosylformylglycinamidine cyclo-ligase